MRLKHLELLGYKTFAAQTEFLFDGRITAIVGPNGSGKSNVADAVRWVLGEQSFSLLRAKKSEDMIFSGSEKRARMGMAQATLTLDNTDNWLPVEFSEVTITRRSYRSGENEYLLNGSKVRLRDIMDLLGKSGLSKRTYTVIGQGLIDTALSLRPQERRALIEEAAGLTLYRSRRVDTLNKLDETRRNILRVHDLIAEISPRLARLRRQAERAQEHAQLDLELTRALGIWYSYQWRRGLDELQRTRTMAQHQRERLETQHTLLQTLNARLSRIRDEQSELRRQLSAWHRESSALHAKSEAQQRDIAVADERRRILIEQRDQLCSEIAALETERAAQAERIAQAEAQLAGLAAQVAAQQAQVEQAERELAQRRSEIDALLARQTETQEQMFTLRTQIADQSSRLTQLQERRRTLQGEYATHEDACRSLQARMDALRARLAGLDGDLGKFDAAIQSFAEQIVDKEGDIAQSQQRQQSLRGQINELEQRLGRLRERHDLLTRMREEGAGLYDGVRHVLQASARQRAHRLEGIVGAVAELVHVPQELEVAIEVALGGQLQDVVVQTWQHAQAAIDYLKRTRGGRATFLPLDTLRPGRPLHAQPMPGLVGLGSELVETEPRFRPVVEYLLGRTLVCRDLNAARRVLDAVKGRYQIVTLEGEIVRSGGAVTGGAGKRNRRGGILSREREWRELPDQIAVLNREREAVIDTFAQAARQEEALREAMAGLLSGSSQVQAKRQAHVRQQEQIQRQIEQAGREHAWHASRLDDVQQENAALEAQGSGLQRQLADLRQQSAAVEAQLAGLRAQIEQADDDQWQEKLAERRAEAAITRQRQAGKQVELRGYQQGGRQIGQRALVRKNRLNGLSAQLAQTGQKLAQARRQEGALSAQIQDYAARIEPAERKLETLERQQRELEADERQARTRWQDMESRHGRTALEVSRQEEHLKSLRRQIEDDLGLVDLEMGEDLSGQPLLPLGALISSLPKVEVLPEGLEEQMRALRRRMRRLGAINPNAPAEYKEVDERHTFLASQAADLEQAITQLGQVIAELDEVMEREFKRTFNAIAHEFKAYFAQLFNGGSARLQLTNPDDLMTTGIDIVARPPGKRQQGLALLSGGERALTAAALVFAILSVSPTPFCILDEVDAALDEANVGRFRAVLKTLAENTQFVVITHNRYTIEAADIVYGVSMNADGASCVISHRMNDQEKAG